MEPNHQPLVLGENTKNISIFHSLIINPGLVGLLYPYASAAAIGPADCSFEIRLRPFQPGVGLGAVAREAVFFAILKPAKRRIASVLLDLCCDPKSLISLWPVVLW